MLRGQYFALNLTILILVAINLRAPITSIGPIAEIVQKYYQISSSEVGLLTSLPLMAFGIFSFFAMYLQTSLALFLALISMLIGEILRSYGSHFLPNNSALFLGTIIIGFGIAIGNVVLPIFVKSKFKKNLSKIMSLYSLIINSSGFLGILVALPLVLMLPIPHALATWTILAFIALIAFLPYTKNKRLFKKRKRIKKSQNLFFSKTAWSVTIFMGFQCSIAYCLLAWFPTFIVEKGYSLQFASNITLFMQLISLPASFICPILLTRFKGKKEALYIACLCILYFLGFISLYYAKEPLEIFISTSIIAIPFGGVFGIVLLFISQKAIQVSTASKLSAMTQGIGYIIGAIGPYLIGKIHDITFRYDYGILLLALYALFLLIAASLSYRAKPI